MKKLVLCVAALIVASAPASAATKKPKAAKTAAAATQPMSQNEASLRLLRESLPLFLPSVGQWIYFHQRDELAKTEATKKVAARKTH